MASQSKSPETDRAALTARLRQGRTAPAQSTAIPRRPVGVHAPLSLGQEQLWFVQQLASEAPIYTVAGALRMRGALDVATLRRALSTIVARHESLRTRLIVVDGLPVQQIDDPVAVELPVTDLSSGDATAEDALRRFTADEAARPFDLATGPLLRLRLARLDTDLHVLVLVAHHTVFDGWSYGVFQSELAALYEAEVAGRPSGLPELPVQFADYAYWERDRLRGAALDRLVEYWRETLRGVPAVPLPTDRPRPKVQSFEGDARVVVVDADTLDGLRSLSRKEETTLFVTLVAAFQTLLYRLSGQDDIVVGTASANRSRTELAPMIGYLVNTLPIRTDLSGDPTFVELLARVKAGTLQAYAHQDLPFAKMVEALRVDRDPSRSPIFQIGFTYADSGEARSVAGLEMTNDPVELAAAKFDLNVAADEREGELTIEASFATALFDAETIERMLGHLRMLLGGVVTNPDRRLSALPLLTPQEYHREVVEWNRTRVDLPTMCLHQRFEWQVKRNPDATAAVLDDERLTYTELNERANQVARRLHQLGVGPEVLVGICMDRSLHRLVALLGVLKAGGGYVPLDPEYPTERLSYMMNDAAIPVVLTDDASIDVVPATGAVVLSMAAEAAALAALPTDNPDYPVEPSNAVYVIYTSGSTGRPKGVVLEHRQVINFVIGQVEKWPLGTDDRILQFASLNFDVSVMDMFLALLSGAAAVFGSRETLLSPPRLADLMRKERVTFTCMPPAVLNLLTTEEFPDLRVLVSAGEALSTAQVKQWIRPGLRFLNGYGPTEVSVGAMMMDLDLDSADPPPIGHPLPNYRAYVLDPALNPVPVGVVGELHLGGPGVARGYLNQPELTAQRFLRNPFGDDPDDRIYKTGDLVRRLADGSVQFIGRIDDQVKIRGLRIELGEIEALLESHPGVAQALVVVDTDRAGEKQLIGYVRGDARKVTPAELRAHLSQRVPGYMVPPHILVLAGFPLTLNGKIDRAALPSPDENDEEREHTPPRTVIEAVLTSLYADLLKAGDVGVEDSFFDLSGNSLQAMQLVTRLRDELAVDVDVTAIFLAPTPAQLATVLRERHGLTDSPLDETELLPATSSGGSTGSADDPKQLVRLAGDGGGPVLFLVHGAGGTVYNLAQLAGELADVFTVYGIEAPGLRGSSADSLAEVVADYLNIVREVQSTGPYYLGGWSMGGIVAFEMAHQLEAAGEQVAFLAVLDAPFQLPDWLATSEEVKAARFVSDAIDQLGVDPAAVPDRDLPAQRQIDWLVAQLEGTLPAVGSVREEITRRHELFRAHMHLLSAYQPRAEVEANALVVCARESPDTRALWQGVLTGDVQTMRVTGDHYTMLQTVSSRKIAAAIRMSVET
ncbi:amino acid adenylation domain-containing protein [Micromonospora sp. HNM0581]|nr:non-ribosomal peptide synthetase [Micromonospora sp. HNM0581]NLU80659.1 amino acid adenylation domain-containing protein [Micromonospora sp. HNM0581]